MAPILRLALTFLGLIALKGSLQDLKLYDDPAVAPHHCEAFKFEVSGRPGRSQLAAPRRRATLAAGAPRSPPLFAIFRYRLLPVPLGPELTLCLHCMLITVLLARVFEVR